MMRASQIAATGMSAQQLNVEVISNNIANLNTTGYKRRLAEFQDLLYQSLNRDVGAQTTVGGNMSPVGSLIGLGVKTGGIFRDSGQGPLSQTNNTYDLAIQGRGFFQTTDANGNVYFTRAGRFSPDQNGILVDPQGFTLDPSLTIPNDAKDVSINSQGEVLVTTDTSTAQTNIGRISLVNFVNEGGLRAVGNNNFSETQASGSPLLSNPGESGYGTLQQGFLEGSNVDAVLEITTLITAQRAYELNSKVVSATDDMLNAVNNIR
jgi:flagellar basal-body rod protein FlgG